MRKNKTIALLLVVCLLAQCLVGCGHKEKPKEKDTYVPEEVITEEVVGQTKITEDNITQELIVENLKCEDYNYELTIDEDFYCEAYIIEIVVREHTVDEIREQLPADIDNYDIDWPKVIGKFAIGTAIIITVGVVHYQMKGATYYVFASPADVAKEAFVGGSMKAAIEVALKANKSGDIPYEAVKKYAIEGFADGYMWGAICAVTRNALANLKLPHKLKLDDGTILKILLDGSVVNKAGEVVGKAYYSKEGIFVLDSAGKTIPYLFSNKGKQIVDISAAVLSAMSKGKLPANSVLQVGFGEAAQTVVTDATGTVFKVNNELLPNCTYRLGKYVYETDSLGRIVRVTFEQLELKSRKGRLPIVDSLQKIAHGFQKPGDDRGHLLADRFKGDNSVANIVAMNSELNQGAYKAMEESWAEAIANGEIVSGTIELVYSGQSFRPDSLEVVYTIGKQLFTMLFENL